MGEAALGARRTRAGRTAAERVVVALQAEPEATDVAWLAGLMIRPDEDHARWEWRYARLALGLLVAERDALNDRTAQDVREALDASLRRDPRIAADRLDVARGQLAVRVAAYRSAMAKRDGREGLEVRLARELLTFAAAVTADHAAALARAGGVLAGYAAAAGEGLRAAFGAASLPEDVAPSRAASS